MRSVVLSQGLGMMSENMNILLSFICMLKKSDLINQPKWYFLQDSFKKL